MYALNIILKQLIESAMQIDMAIQNLRNQQQILIDSKMR